MGRSAAGMNPLLVTLAGLLGSTLVGLQTWTLKELYSLRVALTRSEEKHDALKELRIMDHAEHAALALRVTALEAASR